LVDQVLVDLGVLHRREVDDRAGRDLQLHLRGFDDDRHEKVLLEFLVLLDELEDHFLVGGDAHLLVYTASPEELQILEVTCIELLLSYLLEVEHDIVIDLIEYELIELHHLCH
jgi:hypothetical protein